MVSRTAEINISLESYWKGGWYRLVLFPIRFIFQRLKRGKRNIENFAYSVFKLLAVEKGTAWKLNHPMSRAFIIAFQKYIDLHCTWKHSRDISGKRNTWKMEHFNFLLIYQKWFHVQRRSIYPWKTIEKASDIGWFNFHSVPFSRDKNVENGT